MRHGKRINHLGRTSSHRKAMLSNMASSLILHKRISTTVAKAKELRKYVEPLLTKSKEDTTHSRRQVFSYLQNKESVKELFDEVAERIAARPGGYTRIIKLNNRLGDNADMCMIELVDYNELMLKESASKSKKRTRRAGSKKSTTTLQAATAAPAEEEVKQETKLEETAVSEEEVSAAAEATPEVKASAESAEAKDAEAKEEGGDELSASDEEKKKDE